MSRAFTILLGFLILASVAAAGDGVFRVAGAPAPVAAEARDCRLGSDDLAAYQGQYVGFWDDEDAYAYLVDPRAGACGCAEGVTVQTAWFGIVSDPSITLHMQAELWSARDGGGGCLVPDGPLDISLPVDHTGSPTGMRQLEIPFGSICVGTDAPYFVVVRFLPMTPNAYTSVPVDDSPAACEGYVYRSGMTGWIDPVVAYSWVGNFYLYADLQCCTDPVAAATAGWGELKAMYR